MLLWGNRTLVHLVTFMDLRQAFVVFIHHIVTAFFIDAQKPVELHDLTCGAQPDLFILAANLYGGAFQPRALHLARQRPFPDQIIQLALIRFP